VVQFRSILAPAMYKNFRPICYVAHIVTNCVPISKLMDDMVTVVTVEKISITLFTPLSS